MKSVLFLGLAVALGVVCPGVARAGCAEFQSVGTELSLRYDPFSSGTTDRIFSLRVNRLDSDATAVRFILVDTNPADGASQLGTGGPARYDIGWVRDSSRPVFFTGAEQPNATNGALVEFGQGMAGAVVSETFRVRIPAGAAAAAGDYHEPLEIRYVCYAGPTPIGSPDFQTGNRVSLDVDVPEMIATFVGSAGIRRGEIAFGAINPSGGLLSKSLTVTTQSTIPYDIEVGSQWGALKRGPEDIYALPYTMKLSGLAVTPGSHLTCAATPAPAGRTHPLQVDLDQAAAAQVAAGDYSDIITLTFGPRLGLSPSAGCAPGVG